MKFAVKEGSQHIKISEVNVCLFWQNPVSAMRVVVLVVDDEPGLHQFFAMAFAAADYEPLRADTGKQALAEIACRSPDVVLLDLGLPDMTGQDVLRQARKFYTGPILILSARKDEVGKIRALDDGAQDYIEKPFDLGELMARIRVALRWRSLPANKTRPLTAGDLTIDFERRLVRRQDDVLRLSMREYDLLAYLVKAKGKVLSHGEILSEIFGPDHIDNIQCLRVYIRQIRQKIENDPRRPLLLQTHKGMGYRFVADQ